MRVRAAQNLLAGRQIRALIVDDSVVIRRLVTQALSEDSSIEVVGTAANGKIALSKIPQVNPDVITLDIEMPGMDGLETLREVRKLYPSLCVIMFSTLTERGATHTLEALSLGANDYVTKAANAGSLGQSLERLRNELIPKIKQFFEIDPPVAPLLPERSAAGAAPVAISASTSKKEIVAIGVSTGGPNALAEIFPYFPANLSCPIVVVQHMPPLFTRLLAERLQARSQIRVKEAQEGDELEPGKALIAPGGSHLVLKRSGARVVAALDDSPPVNSCKPAVDVLFASVARIYGPDTLAVILTGMGQDGFNGVKQLKAKGAFVMAQDKATSVVWGMPRFVVEAGLADSVAPLDHVAVQILRQV